MKRPNTQWPTFLEIGVPKAGSTWLYEVMGSNSYVWVPKHERGIKYFNRYIDERNIYWYANFFQRKARVHTKYVGEVTPSYTYCEPDQISTLKSIMPSVESLILVLRNPIDRLYSAYWNRKRINNLKVSFNTFIEDDVVQKNI
jgi:hypothetical protein